jgi:two-component system sensor histidine kinase DegS
MAEETPFKILLSDSRKEIDQVQRELKELEVLIKQSTTEVEKLADRHARGTNHLTHIQSNLETVPRDDIRDAYDVVQDAQQRLFTMRGQLEKLQSDQKNLERYLMLLHRILDVSGDEVEPTEGSRTARRVSPEQPIIVRVIEAQEGERRRLSRAMHDGPAQSMTNFILQTEICQRLFDTDPNRARSELSTLKTASTDTFQQIRDFIFELRPMMLDDLGLVPTLRRYAESFREKHNIPIEVTIAGKERRLEPYKEITIFRVVQELLNNVRNHAQATQVRVAVELENDWVRASVDDNGVGFDLDDALASSRKKQTLGLSTMYERVELLGGRLDIDSKPGNGTRAVVDIPTAELEI